MSKLERQRKIVSRLINKLRPLDSGPGVARINSLKPPHPYAIHGETSVGDLILEMNQHKEIASFQALYWELGIDPKKYYMMADPLDEPKALREVITDQKRLTDIVNNTKQLFLTRTHTYGDLGNSKAPLTVVHVMTARRALLTANQIVWQGRGLVINGLDNMGYVSQEKDAPQLKRLCFSAFDNQVDLTIETFGHDHDRRINCLNQRFLINPGQDALLVLQDCQLGFTQETGRFNKVLKIPLSHPFFNPNRSSSGV